MISTVTRDCNMFMVAGLTWGEFLWKTGVEPRRQRRRSAAAPFLAVEWGKKKWLITQ